METNEPLLATIGFFAAAIITIVDGRNAVSAATFAAGLGLAPSVAGASGGPAAALIIGAAAAAALAVPIARLIGRRVTWMAGLDPQVPVVATRDPLFGPRSTRVIAGALVLPAASWVSFNVPIGNATTVTGALFPAAVVWGCGALRLLTARTIADIAIGVAAVGLAAAAGWLLTGAQDVLGTAAAAAALAPLAALLAGWLSARHEAVRAPG